LPVLDQQVGDTGAVAARGDRRVPDAERLEDVLGEEVPGTYERERTGGLHRVDGGHPRQPALPECVDHATAQRGGERSPAYLDEHAVETSRRAQRGGEDVRHLPGDGAASVDGAGSVGALAR